MRPRQQRRRDPEFWLKVALACVVLVGLAEVAKAVIKIVTGEFHD